MDGHAVDRHVVTKLRVDRPERRVDDFHSFDADVLAADGLDERRAEEAAVKRAVPVLIGLGSDFFHVIFFFEQGLVFVDIPLPVVAQVDKHFEEFVPPGFALSVEGSLAFDGDVFGIGRINQRAETLHHHSFMAYFDERQVVVKICRKQQCGSGFQFQRDVAFQADRSGEVTSGREEERAPAFAGQPFDGRVDESRVDGRPVGDGSCLLHVDAFGQSRCRDGQEHDYG